MQQSLQLLQAPVLELRSLVQRELQNNPALEEQEERDEVADADGETAADATPEPAATRDDWSEYFPQSHATNSERQKKRDFFFDSQAAVETLADHLHNQLTLATNNPSILAAGEEIIGNLDHDGFLPLTLDEIAVRANLEPSTVARALALIQTFTPAGVGARDLKESLLIQLRQRRITDPLTVALAGRELEKIARKRYTELARQYQTTPERVQSAAETIGKLSPHPGAAYSAEQPQNIVQAEAVFVNDSGGGWSVVLNSDPIPRLRVNDTYKDLLGAPRGDQELREYLRERIRAGKFLIRSLHQRQQTMTNILNEIARRQTDFLDHGVSHLKPLTMNQVAAAVGVHETTVSRAAANKYVKTPWGVFPVKYFFTSGYTTSDGHNLANTSVKDTVGEIIAREDPRHPLSDSGIVELLREKGIVLARRTVAKYRDELHILPASLRRQIPHS